MSNETTRKPPSNFAKVVVIGDSGVGKTNLITKYCDGVFKDSYVATIGVDFKLKSVNANGKLTKLQIWDTAGQERFRTITQTYYKGATGILVAYSVNSKESFKNVAGWLSQIDSHAQQDIVKVLVGTKADLTEEREVSQEEGRKEAQRRSMAFLEVSAKTGHNIEELFMELTTRIQALKGTSPSDPTAHSMRLVDMAAHDKKCAC